MRAKKLYEIDLVNGGFLFHPVYSLSVLLTSIEVQFHLLQFHAQGKGSMYLE